MRCSQEQPNRNHHCVMTVDGTRQLKAGSLPCARCWVNLVVDAYHPSARRGNVIVVGSDDDGGIEQDKGMINSVVFDPGPIPDVPRVGRSPLDDRTCARRRPGRQRAEEGDLLAPCR